MNDYYTTLEVDSEIDDIDLAKRYRKLINMYHPENKSTGDIEKYNQIKNAYQTIIDDRRNYSYSEASHISSNFYNTIKENSNINYDNAASVSTNGKFINHKVYMNEIITKPNIVFVDGYAQITTASVDSTDDSSTISFGITKEYLYNYIDQRGNLLFDMDEPFLFHYIGRNIFLNAYSEEAWYIISPSSKRIRIPINKQNYVMTYDKRKLINIIVSELNKKYLIEAKNEKYKFNRGTSKEWKKEYKQFAASDPKKFIQVFVNAISEADEMPKDEYYKMVLAEQKTTSLINNRHIKENLTKI